jgi:hypothetical protein
VTELTREEQGRRLRELASSPGDPEDLLDEVWRCRAGGWTWQELADLLGVTRQAAHKRFAHRLVKPRPVNRGAGNGSEAVQARSQNVPQAPTAGAEAQDLEYAASRTRAADEFQEGGLYPSQGFPELDELDVWPWESKDH